MIGDPWQRQRLLDTFPFLHAATEEFRAELFAQVALVRLPVGQLICYDGAHCTQLPLVLTGTGRVYKLGENGREITLYRVHPGESCVVTTSCILSDRTFPAFAVCESAVEAVVVRPAEVRRWMATSEPWREYIFGLIASRLQEVFGVLDAVLFQRLDQRLMAYLLVTKSLNRWGAPISLASHPHRIGRRRRSPQQQRSFSMTPNVGTLDRTLRIVAGVAIVGWGVYAQNWLGAIGLVPFGHRALALVPRLPAPQAEHRQVDAHGGSAAETARSIAERIAHRQTRNT